MQIEKDLLFRQLRLGNLLVGDFDFQFFLRCFQLFHPSFGGLCENSLLDGVQEVVNTPLSFLELSTVLPQMLFD